MKLIHRFGFYFGGFSIGLIFLMFFLSGKKTSCAYGPNARVLKNINSKKILFSNEASEVMRQNALDSNSIFEVLKYGEVVFNESDTKRDSCRVYTIRRQGIKLKVENCDSLATVKSLKKGP